MSPAERLGRVQLDLDLDLALTGLPAGPPAEFPSSGALGSSESPGNRFRSGQPRQTPATAQGRAETASQVPDNGPGTAQSGNSRESGGRGVGGGGIGAGQIAQVLGRPEPTDEQVAVIQAPLEPVLVVAGAGSGKTETMAARVVWLVANGLVDPDRVLGLTFTRKAAGELAERVRARLKALHRRGLCEDPQPVAVATYHSYAAAVLAEHGLRLGVEPSSRVLGEAGSWQLVDEIVQHWDGDMQGVDSSPATVTGAVLELAAECAEHLVEPATVDAVLADVVERAGGLPAAIGGNEPGRPVSAVSDALTRLSARRRLIPLVEAYRRRKRELEVLDFADQVELAARLARDVEQVRSYERSRFPVVLLDEYQDTSQAQLVLLTSLFGQGHCVTAVGDPFQSIYGWRGAGAGTLERFPRDFPQADGAPCTVLHLSTSWRNDRAVLAAANSIAVELAAPPGTGPDQPGAVRAGNITRTLDPRPDAGTGSVLLQWHTTIETEAAAVAQWARRAWDTDPRGTVAVLCRTRSQFPAVEAALLAGGLPVEVVGLGGLLHAPEISDLRAALEVLHDPSRSDHLLRLLTGPACQLGAADLDALGRWSSQLHCDAGHATARRTPGGAVNGAADAVGEDLDERSLVEALDTLPPPDWTGPDGQRLSDTGRRRLERLAGTLRTLRSHVTLPLADLVLHVERALLLDIEVAAVPGVDPASARARLDAFAEVAAGFAATGERAGLGAFLGWLSAAENQERGLTAPRESNGQAVQLLTIHAAKGLEWDQVAVVGLVEGTFPSGHGGRPPTTHNGWTGSSGALPYPLRGDVEGLPHWEWEEARSQRELSASLTRFRQACGAHQVSEERRLAYVAVTRARSGLLLSGALWGQGTRPRTPSRFLTQVAESAGTVEGIDRGTWADRPSSEETNPADALREPVPWPLDALGERRSQVEQGAEAVREAIRALEDHQGALEALLEDHGARQEGAWAREKDQRARQEEPGEQEPAGPEPSGLEPAGQDVRAAAGTAGLVPDWAGEVDMLLQERDRQDSQDLQVVLPGHLSASRVVALAADPGRFTVGLRRPMPAPPDPATRSGTAFHAWLERRFTAACLIDVEDLPGAADDETDPELQALQARFLTSVWAEATPTAVEVPVETPVAGLVLRGRIDAVFRRPDSTGWDVVDWKTGVPPRGRTAWARAAQLAVYRLAWSRLTGVPLSEVGAAFFYAATGETVRPVDLLDEKGLTELINDAVGRAVLPLPLPSSSSAPAPVPVDPTQQRPSVDDPAARGQDDRSPGGPDGHVEQDEQGLVPQVPPDLAGLYRPEPPEPEDLEDWYPEMPEPWYPPE